jgi:hypothetical protein
LSLLFDNYATLYAAKDRIGQRNFTAVARLLCMKGQMKTGLSSYFVRLRDVSNILRRMLIRLADFNDVIGLGFKDNDNDYIEKDTNYLLDEWSSAYQFV